MSSLYKNNKCTIIGRVGHDIVLDEKNGKYQLKNTLATIIPNVNKVNWINIRAYDDIAQAFSSSIKRGNVIEVQGVLINVQYKDENNGKYQNYSYVSVKQFKIIEE